MALYKFTKAILAGERITLYNNGRLKRDFTYVDDIVDGIMRLVPHPPEPDPSWDGRRPNPATSYAPYRIYNIGSNRAVGLLDFIAVLEKALGCKALIDLQPMQPGDLPETYADIEPLRQAVGYDPKTPIETGIPKFVEWYLSHHNGGENPQAGE
jgi:UDP-glucuronate 4-epimerase